MSRRPVGPMESTPAVLSDVAVHVRQAGQTPLITTTRTYKAELALAARRRRARSGSTGSRGARKRRLNLAWAGVAFVTLVVLTAWVVASVSIWLLPAYVTLLVVIFVVPQGPRRARRGDHRVVRSSQVEATLLDKGASAEESAAVEQHPGAASEPEQEIGQWAVDSGASSPEQASSEAVKPRRGRGRARKAVRTGAEPALDTGTVTWIRVGPGKFVRTDARSHVGDPVPAEESKVGAEPSAGTDLETVVPSLGAPVVEIDSDARESVQSAENVEAVASGLHGIAPSAVSAAAWASSSVDDSEHVASESRADPVANSEVTAPDETETSRLGLVQGGGRGRDRRAPRRRMRCVPYWPRRTIVPIDRAALRANRGRNPRCRASRRLMPTADVRQRQAANTAFGRMVHFQRAMRPRSPPGRLPGLCREPSTGH
jgi:hypothetical protein